MNVNLRFYFCLKRDGKFARLKRQTEAPPFKISHTLTITLTSVFFCVTLVGLRGGDKTPFVWYEGEVGVGLTVECWGEADTGGGAFGNSGAVMSSSSTNDILSPGEGKVVSVGFSASVTGDNGGDLVVSEILSGDDGWYSKLP